MFFSQKQQVPKKYFMIFAFASKFVPFSLLLIPGIFINMAPSNYCSFPIMDVT
jgi:hypothetical protein